MKTIYKGFELRAGVVSLCQKINVAFNGEGAEPVSVIWSAGCQTAAINGHGRITMADVRDDALLSRSMFERYCGFAVHELLHRKYTNFNVRGTGDYVRQLHNACEDIWIERRGIDSGLVGNIEGLLTSLVNGMVQEALTQVTDWSDPRQYPFSLAVWGRRYANKVPVAEGLETIFEEASRRIDLCKNSQDTLDVAEWVFAQMQSLDQPNQKPEQGEQGEQGGGQDGEQDGEQEGGQGGSGEPTGDDQGEGEGEGTPTPASASDGAGKAKRPVSRAQKAANAEPTIHAPENCEGFGYGYSEERGVTSADDHLRSAGSRAYSTEIQVPAKLRYEVKRLFDNSGSESFQLNRKTGALNIHALPSVAGGNVNVFKRRHEAEGIDSAVIVLLDVSGSMFMGLIQDAVKTTVALLDTLDKAQVKTCLMTFGDKVAVQKDFNVPTKRVIGNLSLVGDGGGTADFDAVRYAQTLLFKRPEQRKVVFVITDGESGDGVALRAQIASGEALGVTTIGVGLGVNLSGVYSKSVKVNDSRDIGSVSFKQIKLAA